MLKPGCRWESSDISNPKAWCLNKGTRWYTNDPYDGRTVILKPGCRWESRDISNPRSWCLNKGARWYTNDPYDRRTTSLDPGCRWESRDVSNTKKWCPNKGARWATNDPYDHKAVSLDPGCRWESRDISNPKAWCLNEGARWYTNDPYDSRAVSLKPGCRWESRDTSNPVSWCLEKNERWATNDPYEIRSVFPDPGCRWASTDSSNTKSTCPDRGFRWVTSDPADSRLERIPDLFENEAKRLMDEILSNPELHEYSLMGMALKNPNWLPYQRRIISNAIKQDDKYTEELLIAINTLRYSDPLHRPKALSELIPGDVLLMEPEGVVGHLLASADQLSRGRFFETGETQASASHTILFIGRDENGKMWFLDHRAIEGTTFIDKVSLNKMYGHRRIDVARPRQNIDGRKLWNAATSAIKKSKKGRIIESDFGLVGNNLLCSERMGFILVKIADWKIKKRPLNPVKITPGDLYNPNEIGKYFVVTPLIQRVSGKSSLQKTCGGGF